MATCHQQQQKQQQKTGKITMYSRQPWFKTTKKEADIKVLEARQGLEEAAQILKQAREAEQKFEDLANLAKQADAITDGHNTSALPGQSARIDGGAGAAASGRSFFALHETTETQKMACELLCKINTKLDDITTKGKKTPIRDKIYAQNKDATNT